MQHHVHEVVYNDVIHNGKMESEGEIESAAPLLQDTAALPSAPPPYENKDAVGQQPQTVQPVLPQQPGQPGQPILVGQPAYAQPGQPILPQQPGQPVLVGQPAYAQPGQPILPQQPGQPVLVGQPAYAQPGQPNPVQPMMYTFQGAQPFSAYPRPSYPPPHNYLALALTTMVICAILNVTSLALGVPALILAVLANTRIDSGQWKSSKTYSNAALYLSISNWIYTLGLALIILGSTLGPYFASYYYYYN